MQRDSRKNEYMYYTEGNAVRKVARPTYEAAPRHAEPERRQETHKRTYKNPNEGLTINVPYVMFLLVAACAVVISCMKYINLNSEINSNVDIDAIIKTATEELGMVKISEDSIRFYTSTEGEYMKQFSDVPVE